MKGIHGKYLIQGIQAGVLLCHEDSKDDIEEAIEEAKNVLADPTKAGDRVRICTHDGVEVWPRSTAT